MNRKQAEEQIRKGIVLADEIILRNGKNETIVECSGVVVKVEHGKAYMVYNVPKKERATKRLTARSKKGGN